MRHQLAHAQNMVVDLQHEVHYLNTQLHPILDEEGEDPEMLVEDDGLKYDSGTTSVVDVVLVL